MIAPFTENGSLRRHRHYRDDCRDIEIFAADLVFVEFVKTYSGNHYVLWREVGTNREFPMFLADFAEVLNTKTLHAGSVTGVWTVRQRGAYFGIRLVKP